MERDKKLSRGGRRGNPSRCVLANTFVCKWNPSLPGQMLLCLKPQAVVDPYGTIHKIKPGAVITVTETPLLNSSVCGTG